MCGIVAAVSSNGMDVVPVLVQGLLRLEYRGYDSCGVAVHQNGLRRGRSVARVAQLQEQITQDGLFSSTGIAHTRWATHGAPIQDNAHPHFSNNRIAVVHNGIIENHDDLRAQLQSQGYIFTSQTDTEVIAHLIDSIIHANVGVLQIDLLQAVKMALPQLEGAYAIAVFCLDEPHRVIGARAGSPLILGLAMHTQHMANYIASDAMALAGVTDQIVYLQEGDLVDLQPTKATIFTNTDGWSLPQSPAQRPIKTVLAHNGAAELGPYQHYMQKEIFEQPRAIADTLEGINSIKPELFQTSVEKEISSSAQKIFENIDNILILACGTSYYSGYTAKYWLESIAKIPTQVEVASEYRYRDSVPNPRTLVVTISQSGETADTLAALRHAQSLGMLHSLTVCNVATSAMVRECSLAYITRAGVEIGVASTKAFTTQLAGLFLLTLTLAKIKNHLSSEQEMQHLLAMRHLPAALQAVLALEPQLIAWAEDFAKMDNALFLGRGLHYPIALEGALKLKEISYIHAEAYPAGELKHGPLALVTAAMPVVTVAPNDALLEKLKSNMHEVRARGGVLYVLADTNSKIESQIGINVIHMPEHYGALSPLLHVVPLQLLAYHTALAKGTDVDKPRNLAKSVTVE